MQATLEKSLNKSVAEKLLGEVGSILHTVSKELAKQCKDDKGNISVEKMDKNQLVMYQLAWMTSEYRVAENYLQYGWNEALGTGDMEKQMALTFAAETIQHIRTELIQRPSEYGITASLINEKLFTNEVNDFIAVHTHIDKYSQIADLIHQNGHIGPYGLSEEHEAFRETFKKFAEEVVMPHAEHVHRNDETVPEEIIQ
ncbi:MAG: acyl-CoA dehydrogenase family protein, partial [Leptospiraceae bacterium]|nr:acyl-CoA dehydrogenase family protein [Leptospiraceae bacterium]